MLGMDLSTLSGPELGRLLQTARARGSTSLADHIQREIALRAAGAARHGARSRPPPAPLAEPARPKALHRPLSKDAPPARAEGGRMGGLALVAFGALAGVVGAFAGTRAPELLAAIRPISAEAAPAAARLMAARALPAPELRSTLPAIQTGEAGNEVEPEIELPPPPPALVSVALTARAAPTRVDPVRAAPELAAKPAAPAAPTRMAAVRAAPARPSPPSAAPAQDCGALSLAADRMVCSDPTLGGLHRQLAQAHAAAVAARADTFMTEELDPAWRRARDGTTDPLRLAQLYELRIRELRAAARAASVREEPPH